jgi:hypothetical protein
VSQNPWWHPNDDDLGWDEPLPKVIRLAPDYGAPLPLWGKGFGNIAWQFTKFPPELLDRLTAWQHDFDDNYHWRRGWKSDEARDRWVSQAEGLASDVQAALGNRAELVVDLWSSDEEGRSDDRNRPLDCEPPYGIEP